MGWVRGRHVGVWGGWLGGLWGGGVCGGTTVDCGSCTDNVFFVCIGYTTFHL